MISVVSAIVCAVGYVAWLVVATDSEVWLSMLEEVIKYPLLAPVIIMMFALTSFISLALVAGFGWMVGIGIEWGWAALTHPRY